MLKPTKSILSRMASDATFNRLVCEAVRAETEYRRAMSYMRQYQMTVPSDTSPEPDRRKSKPVVVYPNV